MTTRRASDAIKQSWVKRKADLESARPPLQPITYDAIASARHRVEGEYVRVKLLERSRHRAGWIDEHRAIAEVALGHSLPEQAEVHHFNEVKNDNRRGNLVICQDFRYHQFLHIRRGVQLAGGNPNTDKVCLDCGAAKSRESFSRSSKAGILNPRCKPCSMRKQREYRASRKQAV